MNNERIQVNCCPCFLDWYIYVFNRRTKYAIYVRTLASFWRHAEFDNDSDWYFMFQSNKVFFLRNYIST